MMNDDTNAGRSLRARLSRPIALAGLFAGLLLGASGAAAQTGYTITLVARECNLFTDIMANRARNNIQESLKDLGPDTVYSGGQPISPAIENATNNCTPMLAPWTFTLGRNIAGQDTGTWGRLSRVGGVFRSATTTLAGVPELSPSGQPTGNTIPSAVTIELTAAELQQSASSRLWVQGGVPGQPLNGLESTYAFGALRCAIDNLNGDNVEWNGYPTGSRHIFCYAYYVKPPPTSGTIVVRKNNNGNTDTAFTFRGNISYTPDPAHPGDPTFNYFTLSPQPGASASATFYRAAGSTWNVREDAQPGWKLTAAACVAAGASGIVTNAPGNFSIALVAGDVVTCTYDNAIDPPTAGLIVLKASGDGDPANGLDALGTFGLSITGPGFSQSGSATTTAEDTLTLGLVAPALLVGTTYTIAETWPTDNPLGTWGLDPGSPAACVTCVAGACSVIPVTPAASGNGASFTLQMPATPTVCAFGNLLTYSGSLQVGKATVNGDGDFQFDVARRDNPVYEFSVPLSVTQPGLPVYAPARTSIPWGTYRIVETTGEPGNWSLQRVQCYDQPPGSTAPPLLDIPGPASGYVDVTITPVRPYLRCLFTNALAVPAPAVPVPALGAWSLGALVPLLAAIGALRVRRRKPG